MNPATRNEEQKRGFQVSCEGAVTRDSTGEPRAMRTSE